MQPDSNRRRTFAMSIFGVSTGTPTASMPATGESTTRQDDVEVVNHQVEHDVDVEAAIGKRAEAMHLDEPRSDEAPARGLDGRIEALGVPDRDDRAAGTPGGDDRVGLGDRARNRLLDEHRDAALEQRARDLRVRGGRRGHHDGVHGAGADRAGASAFVRWISAISCARCGLTSTTPTSSTPSRSERMRA